LPVVLPTKKLVPQLLEKLRPTVHDASVSQVLAAIWAELIVKTQATADKVREIWAKQRTMKNVLVGWVSEPIKDRRGDVITDSIVMDLPDGPVDQKLVATFAKKIRAYAILLVERKEREIRLTLESPQGCRVWTLPLVRHGDIWALGKTVVDTKPTETLGILLKKKA
jgi:hypothetical protein